MPRTKLDPKQFTWTAADGDIRTNTERLGEDDILYGVTVSDETSDSGPLPVAIHLLNTGSDRLALALEHGMIWNGDISGHVTWEAPDGLGPFTVAHSIRIEVQNFTGSTITIGESILRGRER